YDIGEAKQTAFPNHPARSVEGALGKSPPPTRRVANDNRVGLGIKPELVRAGNEAGAKARDGDLALAIGELQAALEFERRSRRRISLRAVVGFGDVWLIVGELREGLCGGAGNAVKNLDADGKIRGVKHARAA